MKGLLIKDYKLLKNQKNFLLMILFIGIFFCITNDTLTSGISYILFVLTFSTISTFSYDEADNCMMFLMTLPSGRKDYIRAKYLFGILNPLICFLLLVGSGCIFELIRGKSTEVLLELIVTSIIMLFMALIIFAFYLPIQLKFGSEKVRVVILIFTGTIVGAGYVLASLDGGKHLTGIFESLSGVSEYAAAGLIGTIGIGITLVSYLISIKIINDKEF